VDRSRQVADGPPARARDPGRLRGGPRARYRWKIALRGTRWPRWRFSSSSAPRGRLAPGSTSARRH